MAPLVTGDVQNTYTRFLAPRLERLYAAVTAGAADAAESAAARIAGCGMGLTPSSDDLLCGYFSTLYLIFRGSGREHLRGLIPRMAQAAAERTNRISATFLLQSGEGLANSAVCDLFRSACRFMDGAAAGRAIERVARDRLHIRRGHAHRNRARAATAQRRKCKVIKLEVKKNAYFDSVTLMLISKELKKLDGVNEALVGMGTDLNREIAHNIGVATPELDSEVSANDFFVAVDCEGEAVFQAVLKKIEELLNKKADGKSAEYMPPTLDGALKIDPALNMAIISVPGKFAADVAQSCLDNGINVMLFSDNVTIEEEKALKTYAYEHELLMMGPDCGTAIINHVPLAFANVVRSGDIGIVAASGTGTQEVTSLIDQLGGGVSQVIGTGGRDLKKDIGGLMMKLGLDALKNDPRQRSSRWSANPRQKRSRPKCSASRQRRANPSWSASSAGNARRSNPSA